MDEGGDVSSAGLRKREIDGRKDIELMVQLSGMDEIDREALLNPKGSTLPSPHNGIVGRGEGGDKDGSGVVVEDELVLGIGSDVGIESGTELGA